MTVDIPDQSNSKRCPWLSRASKKPSYYRNMLIVLSSVAIAVHNFVETFSFYSCNRMKRNSEKKIVKYKAY